MDYEEEAEWAAPDWVVNHQCSELCIMNGVLFPRDVVISQESLDLTRVYQDSPGGEVSLTLVTFAGKRHPYDNANELGDTDTITVGMISGYALSFMIKMAYEAEKHDPGTLGLVVSEVSSLMADYYSDQLVRHGISDEKR